MFKISNIQTKELSQDFNNIVATLEDITFSVTIKQSNNKQLDSNIDQEIIKRLSEFYQMSGVKSDLLVQVAGEKVGSLDIVFKDKSDISYYVEIEKSNKKTLWFDYIKILTKLEEDPTGKGIIICPTNYAHKVGIWDLYKEASVYKNHLKRVFGGDSLNRIAVIGYTQYAYIDNRWNEYDPDIIRRIKTQDENIQLG